MGKGMAAYKRSVGERQLDLVFIAERLVRGLSAAQIAKELSAERDYSVKVPQVFSDIKKVMDDWEKERKHLIDKRVAMELAKINRLEQTYWDAWERSQQEQVVRTTKRGGFTKDKDGKKEVDTDYVSETTRRKTSVGNSIWLKGIQWCIEMRSKLIPDYQKEEASDDGNKGMIIRDITFEVFGRKSNAGFEEPIEILPPEQ